MTTALTAYGEPLSKKELESHAMTLASQNAGLAQEYNNLAGFVSRKLPVHVGPIVSTGITLATGAVQAIAEAWLGKWGVIVGAGAVGAEVIAAVMSENPNWREAFIAGARGHAVATEAIALFKMVVDWRSKRATAAATAANAQAAQIQQ